MEKILVVKSEVTVESVEELRVEVRGADNWFAIYTDSSRVYIRTGQDSCSEASMCYSPIPSVGDKMQVGQFSMTCILASYVDYNVDSVLTLQGGRLHLEETKGWDLCSIQNE